MFCTEQCPFSDLSNRKQSNNGSWFTFIIVFFVILYISYMVENMFEYFQEQNYTLKLSNKEIVKPQVKDGLPELIERIKVLETKLNTFEKE